MIVKNLRQKLAETEPNGGRHDFQVEDAATGSAVTLALVKRDALSCLAWEMRVRRTVPANVNLGQRAGQVAGRVTSLLAPLQVVEVDTERNQALLRSVVGASQDNPTYFEIILDGTTTATVRRFQASEYPKTEGTAVPRREQVAFALTNEGLLKLVDDLAS
jgi:hypothetical protein